MKIWGRKIGYFSKITAIFITGLTALPSPNSRILYHQNYLNYKTGYLDWDVLPFLPNWINFQILCSFLSVLQYRKKNISKFVVQNYTPLKIAKFSIKGKSKFVPVPQKAFTRTNSIRVSCQWMTEVAFSHSAEAKDKCWNFLKSLSIFFFDNPFVKNFIEKFIKEFVKKICQKIRRKIRQKFIKNFTICRESSRNQK